MWTVGSRDLDAARRRRWIPAAFRDRSRRGARDHAVPCRLASIEHGRPPRERRHRTRRTRCNSASSSRRRAGSSRRNHLHRSHRQGPGERGQRSGRWMPGLKISLSQTTLRPTWATSSEPCSTTWALRDPRPVALR